MKNVTLVIMAAGIGSRFGGGIKQLEPMGPNGELIIDYSIRHALEAGFHKVVFVIRKDLERDFKEVIGNRIEELTEVAYAYQELDGIPEPYKTKVKDSGREKPWGTGQAILCCKDFVKEPFLVINADDYYGKQAYVEAYSYLTSQGMENENQICMVGYHLKNTLSDNGGVTRGVCSVNDSGYLERIREVHHIHKINGKPVVCGEEKKVELDMETIVSMNMWGLQPEFFGILERGFQEFLEQWDETELRKEYLLPEIIGGLLDRKEVKVKVLHSSEEWFGVTYKEDKESVREAIRKLVDVEK